MGERYKITTNDFTSYMQSIVKLDALETMTQNLDDELEDSQRIMSEIKAMYDSVAVPIGQPVVDPPNNGLRHDDISKFLEVGAPKLLMPNMNEGNLDVDIDTVIASMKTYAEDLKKNYIATQQPAVKPGPMENLDLVEYAKSLDQLNKRLANIKLTKKDDLNNRNMELEGKLTQLCDDVNMFTKMVEAKTTLSECNKNWTENPQNSSALQYGSIINKLLSGINEVIYLLQNKN